MLVQTKCGGEMFCCLSVPVDKNISSGKLLTDVQVKRHIRKKVTKMVRKMSKED